ncbi:MAG: DUF4386 family protein [Flavobacteriales bacterium]|nr:DUF4386 family protein [Flavobacteriales bacterium]
MQQDTTSHAGLYRLAGIAAICAGLLILSFAVAADSHGIFFVPDAIHGGSIETWIGNVRANPGLSHAIHALPVLGFACMLLMALCIHRLVDRNDWRRMVSLFGYLVGVPLAVLTMVEQLSLMNQVVFQSEQMPEQAGAILTYATFRIFQWEVVNNIFGPLFIIILGHTFLAAAAHRAGMLPRWMLIWAAVNASCLLLSFSFVLVPAMGILGFAAPSSMIWLIVLGARMLRRAKP